jgi:hypothetical protein
MLEMFAHALTLTPTLSLREREQCINSFSLGEKISGALSLRERVGVRASEELAPC